MTAPLLSDDEIREAVVETLDSLPGWVHQRMGDVVVIVEDTGPPGLMGLYDPIGGLRRIVIYRHTNHDVEQVRRTVLHEIGHHFGMDENQLRELGYG
jgi:predicted Zn-dependent protease with MMP-like domain